MPLPIKRAANNQRNTVLGAMPSITRRPLAYDGGAALLKHDARPLGGGLGEGGAAPGHRLRHHRAEGRLAVEEGAEVGLREAVELGGLGGADGGRARRAGEERHFAEVVAVVEGVDAAVAHQDLGLAAADDEELVAGLALAD